MELACINSTVWKRPKWRKVTDKRNMVSKRYSKDETINITVRTIRRINWSDGRDAVGVYAESVC